MFSHEQLLMIRQAMKAPGVGANYDTVEKFMELKRILEREIVDAEARENTQAAAKGAPLKAV